MTVTHDTQADARAESQEVGGDPCGSPVSKTRWFHRHRHVWFVAAVQVERYRHGDETNVLHRCDCGRVKVEVIDGGWTPGQLGLKVAL